MALGNYDNNSKKEYKPTLYSAYGTGNKDGIDPSSLGYSFFNDMLKLTISPLKVNNGNTVSYDHDNAASVWLTHTKARMLHDQIKKVLNGTLSNGGVTTGNEGLVRFSDGKELGINNYCLIINKVNESGEVISSYAYEFKSHHHFAVENFNPKDADHKKFYYNTLEVDQLLDLLRTYYEVMTGAIPYGVLNAFRFATSSQNTKMDLIMSKLGVKYNSGMSSRSNSGGSSYFDNSDNESNSREMRTATMDDLD